MNRRQDCPFIRAKALLYLSQLAKRKTGKVIRLKKQRNLKILQPTQNLLNVHHKLIMNGGLCLSLLQSYRRIKQLLLSSIMPNLTLGLGWVSQMMMLFMIIIKYMSSLVFCLEPDNACMILQDAIATNLIVISINLSC